MSNPRLPTSVETRMRDVSDLKLGEREVEVSAAVSAAAHQSDGETVAHCNADDLRDTRNAFGGEEEEETHC